MGEMGTCSICKQFKQLQTKKIPRCGACYRKVHEIQTRKHHPSGAEVQKEIQKRFEDDKKPNFNVFNKLFY